MEKRDQNKYIENRFLKTNGKKLRKQTVYLFIYRNILSLRKPLHQNKSICRNEMYMNIIYSL